MLNGNKKKGKNNEHDCQTYNKELKQIASLEVKTARMGEDNKFQHENLEECRKYNAAILLDISPDEYYITCLGKYELPFQYKTRQYTNPRLPSKVMHPRKTKVSKYDFSVEEVSFNKMITVGDFRKSFEFMKSLIYNNEHRIPVGSNK